MENNKFILLINQMPKKLDIAHEIYETLTSQHIQVKCVRQVIDDRQANINIPTCVVFIYFFNYSKINHKRDLFRAIYTLRNKYDRIVV